ncbi:MAG: head GIN domain-containing protein [Betaproteobacteria bacterium]
MIAARIHSPALHAGLLLVACLLALLPGHARADSWWGERINGSGVLKAETRDLIGFHAITLGVEARLELRQGDSEGVVVTGDDNIIPLIETVVDNGTLKIRWVSKGNFSVHYKKLNIVVHAKDIDGLSVAGSGDIRAAKLKTGALRTAIGGSGDITIDNLEATSLNVSLAGSGDLVVGGRVDTMDVSLSGSGDVSAAKLDARIAKVSLQGSGDVSVWARESLTATVAGSGDVTYYGKPKVAGSVAGSGSVRPDRTGS